LMPLANTEKKRLKKTRHIKKKNMIKYYHKEKSHKRAVTTVKAD